MLIPSRDWRERSRMRAGMQRGGVGETYRTFFPCRFPPPPKLKHSNRIGRDVFLLEREFLRDRLGMRGGRLLRFRPNLSREGVE